MPFVFHFISLIKYTGEVYEKKSVYSSFLSDITSNSEQCNWNKRKALYLLILSMTFVK